MQALKQLKCIHERQYHSRVFDILNGFEIVVVRCLNCHKILELTVKRLG